MATPEGVPASRTRRHIIDSDTGGIMPYLKIQTNQRPADQDAVVAEASHLAAEQLGKPEGFVMVALETGVPMAFAGNTEPAVYMELKSLGLPEDRTRDLSAALCGFAEGQLGVPADRVYVEFSGPPRHMWGFKGGTF